MYYQVPELRLGHHNIKNKMEEKLNTIAVMSAIIFASIRPMRLTQHEAIEDSAHIAESLYTEVYDKLHFRK